MTVISTANNKKEDMKQNNNNNQDKNQDKNNQESNINQKVKVHLVAVGSAPILKKNKFLMNRSDNFGVVISFLVKRLRLVGNVSGGNSSSGGSNSSSGSGNNGVGSNDNNNNTASSLFVYVNSAFVPSPTENIGDLYDCFGMKNNGELILHYSLQEAWGWL